MKFAILKDYGTDGHHFATDNKSERLLFGTFGEAYVHAAETDNYGRPFEVIAVFDKKDITVTLKRESDELKTPPEYLV